MALYVENIQICNFYGKKFADMETIYYLCTDGTQDTVV